MTAIAIRPAVYLHDGHSVSTLNEAASIVRDYALKHGSLRAAALLRQLEVTDSDSDAQSLGLEFRSWAKCEGLLLKYPRPDTTGS